MGQFIPLDWGAGPVCQRRGAWHDELEAGKWDFNMADHAWFRLRRRVPQCGSVLTKAAFQELGVGREVDQVAALQRRRGIS